MPVRRLRRVPPGDAAVGGEAAALAATTGRGAALHEAHGRRRDSARALRADERDTAHQPYARPRADSDAPAPNARPGGLAHHGLAPRHVLADGGPPCGPR